MRGEDGEVVVVQRKDLVEDARRQRVPPVTWPPCGFVSVVLDRACCLWASKPRCTITAPGSLPARIALSCDFTSCSLPSCTFTLPDHLLIFFPIVQLSNVFRAQIMYSGQGYYYPPPSSIHDEASLTYAHNQHIYHTAPYQQQPQDPRYPIYRNPSSAPVAPPASTPYYPSQPYYAAPPVPHPSQFTRTPRYDPDPIPQHYMDDPAFSDDPRVNPHFTMNDMEEITPIEARSLTSYGVLTLRTNVIFFYLSTASCSPRILTTRMLPTNRIPPEIHLMPHRLESFKRHMVQYTALSLSRRNSHKLIAVEASIVTMKAPCIHIHRMRV